MQPHDDTPWPATEDQRRLQRFLEAVRQKWAFEETPAAAVYAAFDRRMTAEVPGFELVAPGRHVRRVEQDILHVVRLGPLPIETRPSAPEGVRA